MIRRRSFFQSIAGLGMAAASASAADSPEPDRSLWLRHLTRIADPVLRNLAAGTLKRNMPVEVVGNNADERRRYTHLEALGRLLSGMAPWLEASLDAGPERDRQQEYRELARTAIHLATDRGSPDFLNFQDGAQPLVDCGFLAQAVLRAPHELWELLPAGARKNLAAGLAASRAIVPYFSNWLLFSATVEAGLASMREPWDAMRVDYALREHQQWYVGDGLYADGPNFHLDYYNSYVIQPMLLDVLHHIGVYDPRWDPMLPDVRKRAQRYAALEERLISPDGTFPPIGRSITYRCGAFHLLAQMALLHDLPAPLTPARARTALTAVIRRTLEAPGTFDSAGWLTLGLCGHQPHLAESYISTGSLYLCAAAFLPLGLAPADPFWSSPAEDWSARAIWRGEDGPADHAL